MRYLVAGRQPWNRDHYREILSGQSGDWGFVHDSASLLEAIKSGEGFRYIFFLHWSERIPESLFTRFECVCFHMTDVPYGRGGSPLQNLISRGHRETKVTALQMTADFDAGPVYQKRALSLEGSSAEEIYIRASRASCEMAVEIALAEPVPQPQIGPVVSFRRRKSADSILPDTDSLCEVFDHIRMLDADGYPSAFVVVGGLRIEFSRATLYHDGVRADVRISVNDVDTEL